MFWVYVIGEVNENRNINNRICCYKVDFRDFFKRVIIELIFLSNKVKK